MRRLLYWLHDWWWRNTPERHRLRDQFEALPPVIH